MVTVLALLKAHWRPIVVAVALVAAFGAGRFATPAKVQVITTTQTVVKTEVKTVEVEKRVEVAAKAETVYVDRTIYKDGTIHEQSKTVSAETDTKTDKVSEKSDTAQEATTDTKTEKTVTADAPRLTVSVMGGYQFGNQGLLKGSGVNLIPNAGALSLGVQVQYRIAGPVQIGVFGLTSGVAGVTVGLTF